MSDLIDKLNMLLKSNLRQAFTLDRRKDSGLGRISRRNKNITPDLERDITALRERINQALDDEDRLQRDILTLRNEAGDWDSKADAALSNGDEANARYAVQQMQLKQQQAQLLEADLEQHRFSAAELIRQVNELEAIAAEAAVSAAQPDGAAVPQDNATSSRTAQDAQTGSVTHNDNSDDLDQRRARLSQ